MGSIMVALFVAIRNFTVAIVLAWMGFSVAPDAGEQKETRTSTPNDSAISFLGG